MNLFKRILCVSSIALLSLGNRGCQTTDTVILAEGPKAAALGAEKDEQIKGLKQQVKDEQDARELAQKLASLAAANFDSILFAATHVDAGLPRNAIEEEAKLGKERLPAADPAEIIKGKDRVIAILQNEVEKAKALYGQAFDEAKQAKADIAEKEKRIAELGVDIANREARIAMLTDEVQVEKKSHEEDVKNALAKKDAEFAAYKKAEADKERRWLINATRIAALGLIVAGAIVLAVFKLLGVGGGLIGAGVLVGLISVGIETLTSQPWWPYLCGGVFLVVVGMGVYGIYRLWVRHKLDEKKTQAIQDMRDEAAAKGDTSAIDKLDEHLEYRMGQDGSFWQKQQVKTEVALGLVDPKGEAKLAGKS